LGGEWRGLLSEGVEGSGEVGTVLLHQFEKAREKLVSVGVPGWESEFRVAVGLRD
jgi:hypothetical protein